MQINNANILFVEVERCMLRIQGNLFYTLSEKIYSQLVQLQVPTFCCQLAGREAYYQWFFNYSGKVFDYLQFLLHFCRKCLFDKSYLFGSFLLLLKF